MREYTAVICNSITAKRGAAAAGGSIGDPQERYTHTRWYLQLACVRA